MHLNSLIYPPPINIDNTTYLVAQGRRKLPRGGVAALLDQSGDAAKGSDIERG